MINERHQGQAAEYALGTLPPDEVREFEQALSSSRELQLFVEELRATAERIPFALPIVTPPPRLKETILANIESADVETVPNVVSLRRRTIFPEWVPWALAACVAVMCIALVGFSFTPRPQYSEFNHNLEEVRLAVLCVVLIGLSSASRRQSDELNRKLDEAREAQEHLQRELLRSRLHMS